MEENLIITPKTKVLQLLEAYPQLEDVLIEYFPAFSKLKNPILRKTVAKIATLQQAANVGNVKVETLINVLRKEVGQELLEYADQKQAKTTMPQWFDPSKVVMELDVAPMLDAGEHPVSQVVSDLKNLTKGDLYLLKAPFLPAPLIDKATSLGFENHVVVKGEDHFEIYFNRMD
ncbi:MAG: DUF1858 domain-containing protein [Bacteroidales bacterium]|jgi:hypothetical protein|nr:DUF1858 domain-containing protein [Bacteroidales bacterium]MDY0086698.1 DUF1858 domain-containing protein [Bacteroidales bacterium]HOI33494.1 DUF1858 domain-containing protein [Bacteroidales bacterium]